MTKDVLTTTIDIIADVCSHRASERFKAMVTKARFTLDTELSEALQVKAINVFWRNLLLDYPNTMQIRMWLCDCETIAAYAHAFKYSWLPMLDGIGIFHD